MAQKPETPITNACLAWLVKQGGDGFHVHGSMYQRKGEPDICGEIRYNHHIYHLKVEVKTLAKTSKPDPLQIYRLQQYHKWGYVVGVVRSVEQLENLIRVHARYRLCAMDGQGFKEYWLSQHNEDPYDLYSNNFVWGA